MPLTRADVLALPAVVDLLTAAHALGIGRTLAYRLVRENAFPCVVVRVGTAYRVPTGGLLALLRVDPSPTTDTSTSDEADEDTAS